MGDWIDVGSWRRASHFRFYRDFEQPFFNICSEADVTALYERTRQAGGPSLFLATLYASARAANEIEAFRLRLRGDRVWRHDVVHPAATVLRDDETFAFAYFQYEPAYTAFEPRARALIEQISGGTDPLASDDRRDDVLYYSVLPWIRFTSFAHARQRLTGDSIPRLVFGQHHERAGRRWLPVSVEVHHALVDGLDVGSFLKRFEALCAETA